MILPGRRALAAVLVCLTTVAAGCSDAGTTDAGMGSRSVTLSGGRAPVEGMPRWQGRPGLAVPRDDFVTAVVGEEIWVLGGMTGDRGTRLESVEVYDTRADRWRTSDVALPRGLASFEGVAVGEEVFVFGGLDADSRPTHFSAVLDTSTGRWRRLPPLPTARYAHTVTLHSGKIYVIGGESAAGATAQVDVFDPRTEEWSTGEPMPRPRGSHDAVSAEGKVYVLGGWLDGGATDLVQTYDPVRGRWSVATPLPEAVSRGGAAVLDGRLWVAYHQVATVMDLDQGTWSAANPLPKSRHGLGFVPVGSSIYAIGGCSEYPLRDVRDVDELELG